MELPEVERRGLHAGSMVERVDPCLSEGTHQETRGKGDKKHVEEGSDRRFAPDASRPRIVGERYANPRSADRTDATVKTRSLSSSP